ncbi:tyrosine-type recombinase/integrase [Mycolicibacter heraklionensis]|uniref:tyrosine-type recombinase/integrase n=1 Tax=Mycolicibacter heraklionensis TaxID=512402 RepID=UPI00069BFEF5|nr:site-specific integrase [Mycolicibacter heraklionensis]
MSDTKRNQRAGIDDRWHKRVKQPDGTMRTERSPLYERVTRWRVRWVDDTSKERTKSFQRKPDAQAFLNTLTADVVRGDYVSPDKAGVTFGTVAEDWYKTKSHRKPKTLAGYRGLLDTLVLPRWESVPLKDVDYRELSQWLSELGVDGSQNGKPLSASRIRQAHQLVHAVFKYAQRSGLVSKNVAAQVERKHDLPTENERVQHALTHAQLIGLARHMGQYATLTLVLGYTGIRLGEAAALRRRNVSVGKLSIMESATRVTGRGMVTTKTKTGKNRDVAVPGPVWDVLEPELPDDPVALVFPNPAGTELTNHQYRYLLDKAVAAMQAETNAARNLERAKRGKATTPEFPSITPHDLRHTCAPLLISSGANIKVVQRQLGHATAAMTLDRYGHLYDADLTRAADELGKAIKGTAVPLRYGAGIKKVRAS